MNVLNIDMMISYVSVENIKISTPSAKENCL